jgi:hypothetical protein
MLPFVINDAELVASALIVKLEPLPIIKLSFTISEYEGLIVNVEFCASVNALV